MALQWKRICPGYYKARTGPEFWQEFTAYKTDEEWGDLRGNWMLTYPTFSGTECEMMETLREAKECASDWAENLRHG